MPFPQTGKRLDIGPKAETIPVRQVTVNAGEYLHWSGDSRAVHYALGDELFTRRLDETFAFVPGAPPELPKAARERREGRLRGEGRQADGHGRDRRRARRHDAGRRGRSRTGSSSSARTASSRSGRVPRRPCRRGATVIDAAGKTIIPGLVDVHWHGGMGEDEIIPQQSWMRLRVARLRRDDRPRPVERHERDLHARRDAEGRARGRPARSSRPGRSSTAPRRRSPRRSTASTTRSRTSSACARPARSR